MRLRPGRAPETEFEWLFDDQGPEEGRAPEIADPIDRSSTIGACDRPVGLPAAEPEPGPSRWRKRALAWLAAGAALLVGLVIATWTRDQHARLQRTPPPITTAPSRQQALPSPVPLSPPSLPPPRQRRRPLTRAGRPRARHRQAAVAHRLEPRESIPPRVVSRPPIRTMVVRSSHLRPTVPTGAPTHTSPSPTSPPGGGLAFGR